MVYLIGVLILKCVGGWLLGNVRMLAAGINAELAKDVATEAVVRDHAFDGTINHFGCLASGTEGLGGRFMVTTDITSEPMVFLLDFFFAGEDDLVSVDDHNEVTIVHVWSVSDLFLAAKQVGGVNGDISEHPVGCIDEEPLTLNILGFG